jgi:hypothetical protein
MRKYDRYTCDGDLCNPTYNLVKENDPIPSDAFINFCDVLVEDHILPEGWGYYKEERKLRCPRCVEHKEKTKGGE